MMERSYQQIKIKNLFNLKRQLLMLSCYFCILKTDPEHTYPGLTLMPNIDR